MTWMMMIALRVILIIATCTTLTPPLAHAAYDCDSFTSNRKCLSDMSDSNVDAVHSGINNEANDDYTL